MGGRGAKIARKPGKDAADGHVAGRRASWCLNGRYWNFENETDFISSQRKKIILKQNKINSASESAFQTLRFVFCQFLIAFCLIKQEI